MSDKFNPITNSTTNPDQPMVYQIRLQGHLDRQWANWFVGLTITLTDDGDTLLTGPMVDQAALFGCLRKVRDSGMTLLAVNCVDPDQADASNTTRRRK